MLISQTVHDSANSQWLYDFSPLGALCRKSRIASAGFIRSFTDEGTYTAAIKRLDNLVELGVTAIELMPLAECPGRWNWGYDGACIYAPSHNYGSPEELHRFVSACHDRGLAVILDVGYNHLGPEGNYLDQFGPYFGGASTPWGVAPSVSGKAQKPVRDFFVDNALHWIENYGFDGLRLDAIAMIRDDEPTHLVNEIGEKLRERSSKQGHPIYVIGETNLYRPEYLSGQKGSLDAIWVDDLGRALCKCIGLPDTSGSRTLRGFPDLCTALRQGYLLNIQRTKVYALSLQIFQDGHPHILIPKLRTISIHIFRHRLIPVPRRFEHLESKSKSLSKSKSVEYVF